MTTRERKGKELQLASWLRGATGGEIDVFYDSSRATTRFEVIIRDVGLNPELHVSLSAFEDWESAQIISALNQAAVPSRLRAAAALKLFCNKRLEITEMAHR
jgi:hypothetical protein